MCRELTSVQLDLVIIGELLACSNSDSGYTDYLFHAKPICRVTFCAMHAISLQWQVFIIRMEYGVVMPVVVTGWIRNKFGVILG